MRTANYHKSSNDFDTTAHKMNKKLKAKPLEQCRCYNNEDGRRALAARKESGEHTSWCYLSKSQKFYYPQCHSYYFTNDVKVNCKLNLL
jgi:hypothetical protein